MPLGPFFQKAPYQEIQAKVVLSNKEMEQSQMSPIALRNLLTDLSLVYRELYLLTAYYLFLNWKINPMRLRPPRRLDHLTQIIAT